MPSHENDIRFCRSLTVPDEVLKLGYTGLILIDLGLKFDRIYYCDLLLSQQLLLAILQVSVEFLFWQDSAPDASCRTLIFHKVV